MRYKLSSLVFSEGVYVELVPPQAAPAEQDVEPQQADGHRWELPVEQLLADEHHREQWVAPQRADGFHQRL